MKRARRPPLTRRAKSAATSPRKRGEVRKRLGMVGALALCPYDGAGATFRFNFQPATHTRPRPAARCARASDKNIRPGKQRAQGMPGARCTRSLVCKSRKHTSSHHRFSQTTRHSLRNGFNGLLRALPGDRAFLSPSPGGYWLCQARSGLIKTSTGLDAGVEASGPHDFAVRVSVVRPRALIAHRSFDPPCDHFCAPDTAASTASRSLRP
jgi:hypothetical protein